MKHCTLLLVTSFLFAFPAFAKGGSCSGHGAHCSGHGSYVAGHHSSKDADDFKDLRKNICTGYVVYGADTLAGIIVCADNTICIKETEEDTTHRFAISDTCLHSAMLQDNGNTLYLVRLENKKLYRVFHTGKLSIYDTYYSFDRHSKQFFLENSWMKYNDKLERLNGFFTTGVKKKLVAKVNEVYGLSLVPKEYKKAQLLAYIDKLD